MANSMTFDLGRTVHGAPLRLVCVLKSNGEIAWAIDKEAANQRDDDERIAEITTDSMRALTQAVPRAIAALKPAARPTVEMWTHTCSVERAKFEIGKDEPCAWCGAEEEQRA